MRMRGRFQQHGTGNGILESSANGSKWIIIKNKLLSMILMNHSQLTLKPIPS